MKPQFEGKKVFLIGSAPDPKIDYEKVKDHIWVTMKGSIWSINNVWGLDRIPDYHFMTGIHIKVFNDSMWESWKTKNLIHIVADPDMEGEWQLINSKKLDYDTYEEIHNLYLNKGVEFDNLKILPFSSVSEGARRIVEFNYFIKNKMFFRHHLSIGVGLLLYILLSGAEEVVLSGFSINKDDHAYTGTNIAKVRPHKLPHSGEDMISLFFTRKFGWNVKTFEPALHEACNIPMK